ncbi:unnamed protein product [Auanema sp. JU1783]|nr:unnamed protein product [Auanema sp. JU1783]
MNGDVKKEELELKEETSETVEAKPEKTEKNDTSDLKETVEPTEAKEPSGTEVIKSPKVEGEDEDSEEDALAPNENVEVKPPPQVDVKQLHSNPDFASICSFFNKFGAMIGFKPMSFPKLENMLTTFDDQGRISKELIDLHLALMRRLRMSSIRFETWETYLKKFLEISEGTSTELLQLERYGYVHLPVSTKILILKYLCDAQFDFNPRLKENMVAACKAVDLRLIPVGMDKNGFSYWFQQDVEYNIRVYTEEPDDLSGVTWSLVVNTPEDLINLIARLKKEDLGYVKKEPTKKEKEKEEARKAQQEEGLIQMTTKKGTFLDTCYDDASVKKMREDLIKQKEERKQRREKKQQESENEEEEEEEEEKQPEEQEEELDRRMMPRRSAASKAVSNLKKFATTPRKSSGPRKKKEVEEADDEEKKSASGSESGSEEDEEEDEFQSEEDNNDEDDDDDEFRPKSEKKKKGKKRRRKKKVELDDDDDDDDSDEDEEPKERKLATGDSACGQCKKSSDWDVLLLCDVCDDAWHTYCLKPMLWFVPDGDWFCPKCVHGMLIERLEEVEKCLDGHLKKKMAEDRRKKAAADRLRREMEYIGVSLNNIIPTTMKQAQPSSSSSSDEDDGQRRSKRKAVKRIAPRSKFQMEVIQTIAEGRSRRRTKHVDYNFSEYDSMIHEACTELGDSAQKEAEPGPAGVVRPTGGAGRGKDMANILEAEKIRKGSVEGDEDDEVERQLGKPARSQAKPKRKLNDLDIDNREESDSEEYQANESDEEVADEEEALSGSDYVPSDEQRRTRRSGTRAAGFREYGPTQSDEDFVVSGSEDSDFGYRGKKRKIEKRKIKKKKGRWNGSDSEESDNYSDDSDYGPQKKKEREKAKKAKYSSSEDNEDEEELELPSEDDEDVPRTETGRPMRKAVVKAKTTKESDDELDEDEEEEEEEEEELKKKEERPVGALDRSERNPPDNSDDSEEDFKPDDAEEEEDEEEDEEEEVILKETPKVKKTSEEKDDFNQAKKRKPLDEDVSEPSLKRVKENVPDVKKNEPVVAAKPIPSVASSIPSQQPVQTTSPKNVKITAPVPVTQAAPSRNEVEMELPHPIAKPKVLPPKPIPQGPPNYGVPGPYMNHYYQGPPANMPPYGLPPAPYNPYAPPAAHWQQPPPNLYGPPPATALPHNPYAPVPVPNPYSQSTSQ